ncbi:MAG: sodium-translocating pyrophosphatase [bacterium JZ-2024 1]
MAGPILLVVIVSVSAVVLAAYLAKYVLGLPRGTPEMQGIAQAIQEGASAFLKRQYSTITLIGAVVAVLIFLLYAYGPVAHAEGDRVSLALRIALSFLLGALMSGIAGTVGMLVSVRANLRSAAALEKGMMASLKVALFGGAVSGLLVVALSLLGIAGLFIIFGGLSADERLISRIPYEIVGFGFGASLVALFAQLGGGIYTKAADVGADLVGKVEAGIPEDDPRNPAVVADLVGDNVGDCAGRGADLFESISAENIGAMILGVALIPQFGFKAILFPLVARAFGLIATAVGIFTVSGREEEHPMRPLTRGFLVTTLFAMGGFFAAVYMLLDRNLYFFLCGVVGLVTAVLILYITVYYTEYYYSPVLSIVKASRTGAATNIITGLAVAFECTALPTIVLSLALLISYQLGQIALPGIVGAGLYGTAIATMGMLAPCAYILAMDTFGPIVDNAGGVVEMSGAPEVYRERAERLDAAGNTTKALTKGYAIGSAALSAFLLFRAYLDEVDKVIATKLAHPFAMGVDITRVWVFIGGFIGAGLVFIFAAFAIRAVGRAAHFVIDEVRRQFRERPGILRGTEKPDYGTCVDIVTRGALKEMVLPGLLAVLTPVVVGILFRYVRRDQYSGAESVAALLMFATVAGILVANLMNNGGAAWDNAKKFVEKGNEGGKGSDVHKVTVIGDTVGDPFKDTAGPSIHVLIKLLSTVSLVLAPLFF